MATEFTTCDAGSAKKFQLVGGDVCLDFTNTVGGKRGATTREYLNGYADLLSWCRQAAVIDELQSGGLAREAGQRPEEADRVLARAIDLREAIYRIFLAVADGRNPSTADLGVLNQELASALGRLRVGAKANAPGFTWSWAVGDGGLATPLGPLARAAADLLTDDFRLRQIRQCGGDNCGWLFVDVSKNHSRRWCDMRDCGNRAKVRRYRLKRQEGG